MASRKKLWLNKIAVEKEEITQEIIQVCLFKGNSWSWFKDEKKCDLKIKTSRGSNPLSNDQPLHLLPLPLTSTENI